MVSLRYFAVRLGMTLSNIPQNNLYPLCPTPRLLRRHPSKRGEIQGTPFPFGKGEYFMVLRLDTLLSFYLRAVSHSSNT